MAKLLQTTFSRVMSCRSIGIHSKSVDRVSKMTRGVGGYLSSQTAWLGMVEQVFSASSDLSELSGIGSLLRHCVMQDSRRSAASTEIRQREERPG